MFLEIDEPQAERTVHHFNPIHMADMKGIIHTLTPSPGSGSRGTSLDEFSPPTPTASNFPPVSSLASALTAASSAGVPCPHGPRSSAAPTAEAAVAAAARPDAAPMDIFRGSRIDAVDGEGDGEGDGDAGLGFGVVPRPIVFGTDVLVPVLARLVESPSFPSTLEPCDSQESVANRFYRTS